MPLGVACEVKATHGSDGARAWGDGVQVVARGPRGTRAKASTRWLGGSGGGRCAWVRRRRQLRAGQGVVLKDLDLIIFPASEAKAVVARGSNGTQPRGQATRGHVEMVHRWRHEGQGVRGQRRLHTGQPVATGGRGNAVTASLIELSH